jgi:long-subunit acyl-CoA synthetase (AMP-forming)
MLAYLDDVAAPAEIATGDLGRLDGDGNLYVTGRKKDVFITSFGRNVSPEWPEAELLHETGLLQACVFGEARSKNIAILVIDAASLQPDDIATVIARVNLRLPDYARIGEWIVADEPFTPVNGLLTPNGKISRQKIADRYVFDRTLSVASAI